MSADVVIRAEGLGKKYVIGHQVAERVPTLRDAIARSFGAFARTARDMLNGRPLIAGDKFEEFWALKDVNFEINRGDVVGIIGRNGAGKSTLLKVLSRITEPSEGRAEIRGRVASLLEVGTGFHPELTGRENIYLNGAILGMGHEEIRRKFDEIVAFAEIERFLDTPVKRYSSGMYVRLAFAVAAHLEPEILIIDEVLAVGDAVFQKKCLGKMQDVAEHGRTVLFVSHQLGAVERFCTRGILLSAGSLAFNGPTQEAIQLYLSNQPGATYVASERNFRSDHSAMIAAVKVINSRGAPEASFRRQDTLTIAVDVAKNAVLRTLVLVVSITNSQAVSIANWYVRISDHLDANSNTIEMRLEVAPGYLTPSQYTIGAALFEQGAIYDRVDSACTINITEADAELVAHGAGVVHGAVIIPGSWAGRRRDAGEEMPARNSTC